MRTARFIEVVKETENKIASVVFTRMIYSNDLRYFHIPLVFLGDDATNLGTRPRIMATIGVSTKTARFVRLSGKI